MKSKRIQISQVVFYLMMVWMAVGCAAIIHGTTQDIEVRSAPDNAEVWIDGSKMGITPTRLTLKRNKDYNVKIVRQGYKEVEMKIEGKTSSWIIGNIIFGGIPGCIIDFVAGSAYDLTPERLDVNLTKVEALNGKTITIDPNTLGSLKQIRLINEKGEPEFVVNIAWVD